MTHCQIGHVTPVALYRVEMAALHISLMVEKKSRIAVHSVLSSIPKRKSNILLLWYYII
jgi:hypothetical protein